MALRTERIVQGPRAVAAVSADGQMLATAGDNTILIRDLASGELRATLSGHRGSIVQIAFSPDGRLLASASRDRTGKLWDVSGGRLISSLDGHRGAVTAVAFSPDGRTLATAGADRAILLWNVPPAGGRPGTLRERATWTGHTAKIISLAFSHDGKWLSSGSDLNPADKTAELKLWDAAGGREIVTWKDIPAGIAALAFAPNDRVLAVGCEDGVLRVFDPVARKPLLARPRQSRDPRIGVLSRRK